jgi:hypothetical protein
MYGVSLGGVVYEVNIHIIIPYINTTNQCYQLPAPCPSNMTHSEFLMVAFYTPEKNDPWLNHIVASVDGPCCHVELAFPDASYKSSGDSEQTASMQTVCVYQGGSIEITRKRFSRQNYSFQYIPVTSAQAKRVLKMAKHLQSTSVHFSQYSMFATFIRVLPLWYHQHAPQATCCSILTTQLLQTAGVVETNVNARRMTPSGLQRMLNSSSKSQLFCFGATPFRLQQIRAGI